MQQPPGFVDPSWPDHDCKLQKAIYGLKESHRAWYSWLSVWLCQLGFMPLQADTSLFVFHSGGLTIYMLVYVADIVIISSSDLATQRLL
jgi:hypothetical protein